MSMLVILITIRAQEIIQDFGEISLPLNNSLNLHFLDYFSGNFLEYSVECFPKKSAVVEVTQSRSQNRILNTVNNSLSFNKLIPRYRMPSLWNNSDYYSFYFDESKVYMIKAGFSSNTINLFKIIDFSQYEGFYVSGLSLVKIENMQHLFVFGLSQSLQKNLFFTVELEYFNINPFTIENLEKVKDLHIDSNINSSFLCLNGTLKHIVTLFIFSFSQINEPPILLFKITEFLTIPGVSSNHISITSYFMIDPSPSPDPITLVVIDKSSNFIYFTMNSKNYTEHYSLPLGLYGEPFAIELITSLNFGLKLFSVITNKGIVSINFDFRSIFDFWPFPMKMNQLIGFFLRYKFLHYFYIDDNSNLVVTVSSVYKTNEILYTDTFRFDPLNLEGPWSLIESIGRVNFLHLDYTSINIVSIKTFDPMMKIWMVKDSVECIVIAADQLSKRLVKNSIKLINLNSSNFEISNIYRGSKYIQKLTTSIHMSDVIVSQDLPIFMVSGWNVSCTFDQVVTDNLRISDASFQKVTKTISLKFINCSQVFVQNSYLFCIDNNKIIITNVTEENGPFFYIDDVIQVQVSNLNETAKFFAVLCENHGNFSLKILVVNQNNYNQTFEDYEVNKTLSGSVAINLFNSLIFIYDQSNIFVLKYNYMSMKFEYFYLIQSNSIISPINSIAIINNQNFEYLINIYITFPSVVKMVTFNTLNNGISNIDNSIMLYISNYSQLFVNIWEVYVIIPGKILVYDHMLTEILREINIELFDVLMLESFLVGKSPDSQLLVINGTETFMIESVYFFERTTDKIIGFTFDLYSRTTLVLQGPENLSFYTLLCPSLIGLCNKNLILTVELINEKEIHNLIQNTQLNLQCNNFYYSQNFSYFLTIYLFGLNIDSETKNITLNYDYDTQAYFNFSDKFKGYDLDYSIHFSNKNFNSTKLQPVSVINSISLVKSFHLDAKITGFTLIKNSSFVAVTSSDNRAFIFDMFDESENIPLNYSFSQNMSCPLVEYVTARSDQILFVAVCYNYTADLIRKYFLTIVLADRTTLDMNNSVHIPLNFSYNILKIIPASERSFLIAIVEVQPTITFNNHIELFKGTWKNEVKIEYFQMINFFTLNIDSSIFTSIEGEYTYTGSITLYLVDILYGVRIVKYLDNSFKLFDGIPISCTFTSMALCGHQLYVGCLDTSVILYKRSNGNFSYLSNFYPYNNNQPFRAMTGYMDCNNYYHSDYIIMPIKRSQDFSIRVLSIFNNLDSQILKDVPISNNSPQEDYSTKAKFYNDSIFVTFDLEGLNLMIFSINQPSLVIPKLTKDQYKEILKVTDGKPPSFYLNVSNKITSIVYQNCLIDRGKLDSNSDDEDFQVPSYVLIVGVIGILIIMGGCSYAGYKIFKLCEKKQDENLNYEKPENVKFMFSAMSLNT